MDPLSEFYGAVRGMKEIEREALVKMLTNLRDDTDKSDGLGNAVAAGMNTLLMALVDERKRIREDAKQFERMLAGTFNGAEAADFTTLPTCHDR